MTQHKDTLYSHPHNATERFTFDEKVAAVFSDMINRSVPGYDLMLEMIGAITRQFAQPNTQCYDLGCSLGASTLAIANNLSDSHINVIGVDNSTAMVERCQANLANHPLNAQISIRCEDLRTTNITNASLVAMNFTLQFIEPSDREILLQRIWSGLRPGGALILSEKIAASSATNDQLLSDLHHQFKGMRGYSQLEIAQKRDALDDVLIPDRLPTHTQRLYKAGFNQVIPWFQCFNFVSLLAIK